MASLKTTQTKQPVKEKESVPLDKRKLCGTMIEGPENPYRNYVDLAKRPDPYYTVKQKE